MNQQPALAGPGPTNGPTLESLPAEILHSILDFLVPKTPNIGETRPVKYDSLVPGEFWHTFTRGRRGLWSLCLVSRKFLSLAQKLLYKTVAILDEDSLVLFFRTAFETGLPSTLTRSFSCHLTLTRPAVGRNIQSAVAARLTAEAARLPAEAARLPAEATRLLGEATGVLGEVARLPTEAVRLPGEAIRLLGEVTCFLGEAVRLPGETARLPGEAASHVGEAARLLTEAICLLREAAHLPGEAARILEEAARVLEEAARVLAKIANSINYGAGGYNTTPEGIMLFLLVRLVRLETLMVQLPICDDHSDYSALLSDLMVFRELTCGGIASSSSLPTDVESASMFDPAGAIMLQSQLSSCFPIPPEAPFMHLETLMLQGDPELREYFEEDDGDGTHRAPETWGAQAANYALLCMIFPALTTLEVSTDDGKWELRGFGLGGDESVLKNIRHFYLHESLACPRNLHHILRGCPNLETLYMTPRIDVGFDDNFMDEPDNTEAHPESLNTALIKYGKKLRHLDVGWFELQGGGTLIGPEGRLAALPRLPRLEKLCVPLAILYGTDVALVPLADLLPPNIVDLTLEDWWWSDIDDYDEMHDWNPMDRLEHYRSKRDYRTNALNSLVQFASDAAGQPRLKTVLLLCHIPWTWIMEEGVPLDTHFTEVKEAFRLRGVEFLVDEA